ncbi:MAG: 1-(5-phosphoribosyl)-5-[(5-phosphoribosylamino)methylideneamino] imidazole-4-carboxamide isomerase [Acidobacteriaceae bacterium]|nr:1-(5-phosphoribosyl)-5-[(5-phosphoribosylamino)methylideneamino] imidazole-4-carboxamide isomerase [Acidobacteriaceae bacterium]
MIFPCIDLMGGKVVQLVQGREKVLDGLSPDEMLDRFSGFPQLQVIDLDAAMGKGSNAEIVEHLAGRARIRAGGGVRTVERARELVKRGVYRVILGTAAFGRDGINVELLSALREAVGRECVTIALDSKGGQVVVSGWKESTRWTAVEMIPELEPYCSGFLCTYVDKEGLMQGTDLAWFERLRQATSHELVAAGGITTMDDVRALTDMGVACAIGMAIYTGRLPLEELRSLNHKEECR